MNFITKFFGKKEPSSKESAKQRLKLVLVHDRASLSPRLVETIKEEIMEVISKYVEIDNDKMEMSIDEKGDTASLVANIPVRGLKRVSQKY